MIPFSLNIVVSAQLGCERVQVRFPRSKRKRIRRKWAKNPRNWTTRYTPTILQFGDMIICDPGSYARLTREMRSQP